MTRIEMKALMAAHVAAGMLARERNDWAGYETRAQFAKCAVLTAEELLKEVEQRSTPDDNETLYIRPVEVV